MKKLIVGNWKMHGDAAMAHPLIESIADKADRLSKHAETVICPPATLLSQAATWIVGSVVHLGGQDCHGEEEGAFTGDISVHMLKDVGCTYVIVGHSERRQHHHESNHAVRRKVERAMEAGLIPILCVGETQAERDGRRAEEVVARQVKECLPSEADSNHFVLAYEPVWAIGSGKTPTGDDIRKMHVLIRSSAPKGARVLYGGSVKGGNARDILATEGVAGVLVGGASLKADEFSAIMAATK